MKLKPPATSNCPGTQTPHEPVAELTDLFSLGAKLLCCKHCGLVYWLPEEPVPYEYPKDR